MDLSQQFRCLILQALETRKALGERVPCCQAQGVGYRFPFNMHLLSKATPFSLVVDKDAVKS